MALHSLNLASLNSGPASKLEEVEFLD